MHINLLGFGTMAQQIGGLLVSLGHDITIWNYKEVCLDRIYKQIKLQSKYLDFGNKQIGKISVIGSLDGLNDHLTIEAIVEDLQLKKEIYEKARQKVAQDYFTSTSSFSPLEIGKDVKGIHFFNPLFSVKVIEIFSPTLKDDGMHALLQDLRALGFVVINVLNTRGYIANYIIFNEISNVFKLMEVYNYPLREIEKVYSNLFNKNLFKMIDIVGVDVTYTIIKNLKEHDSSVYLPKVLEEAMRIGILGKKNGTSIKKYIEKLYGAGVNVR